MIEVVNKQDPVVGLGVIRTIVARICFMLIVVAGLQVACQADFELSEQLLPVIYGQDDRQDAFAFSDSAWAASMLDCSVAIVDRNDLEISDPGWIRFVSPNLKDANSLCEQERFWDQPTAARCSGVLIAPDLVLTAGHCIKDDRDCFYSRLVFGYAMQDSLSLRPLATEQVYRCNQLLVQQYDSRVDYAVIRLDRPAPFIPAKLKRQTQAVESASKLLVAGYPSGLPLKIAADGHVRDNRKNSLDYFVANTDTFRSSSGSGVFDQDTRELLGVLVRGESDFVYDGMAGCCRMHVCEEDGCRGEDVTYLHQALLALCKSHPGESVCACGDGNCDVHENSQNCCYDCGSRCADGVCNGLETPLDCPEDCGLCGNQICEISERDSQSCCADCGCEASQVCIGGSCYDQQGGDSCERPLWIHPEEKSGYARANLVAATTTVSNRYIAACGGQGPEQIYTFTITQPSDVTVEVEGYDSVLYLRSDCEDSQSTVACNDNHRPPGNEGSRLALKNLEPGTYFLFVDGFGPQDHGDYRLEMAIFVDSDADGA